MATDDGIWDRQGTLTLARDAEAPMVDLPPLPEQGGESGPLRLILRRFLDAPAALRARYSLRLENGQTFNGRDIAELLARDDCPVR